MSVNESIQALRLNLTRWSREVSTGDARGTLLYGIAGKAAGGFENLLRDCLLHFLKVSGLAYESELAPTFSGKSLEKLTLGEVVQSLDMVGGKLSRLLGRDLLVRRPHKSRLGEITALRNKLHHHPGDKFAKDEAMLIANTSRLLLLIREELSEPLFQGAAEEKVGEGQRR